MEACTSISLLRIHTRQMQRLEIGHRLARILSIPQPE
jgi:hypothetical protein